MHPILVEDQQYQAIQARLAKVATNRWEFAAQQRMAADDFARRAGDAALTGEELPPPPPDVSVEVLGRLDREEAALRGQIAADAGGAGAGA